MSQLFETLIAAFNRSKMGAKSHLLVISAGNIDGYKLELVDVNETEGNSERGLYGLMGQINEKYVPSGQRAILAIDLTQDQSAFEANLSLLEKNGLLNPKIMADTQPLALQGGKLFLLGSSGELEEVGKVVSLKSIG